MSRWITALLTSEAQVVARQGLIQSTATSIIYRRGKNRKPLRCVRLRIALWMKSLARLLVNAS
jgi:hypothetical protein